MNLALPISRCRQHGFTLLEVVAVAVVFMLIMGLLLQILNDAGKAVSHQSKRIEAAGSARRALDTLAQDISVLVRENGGTLLFRAGDEIGNDELKFLCLSRPAPGATKPRMSLVSYAVERRDDPGIGTDVPMLIRSDESISWPAGDESVVAEYDFPSVLDRSLVDGHVASDGVFRFEILWMRKNGVICREPPEESASTSGSTGFSGYRRVDLSSVGGFIVTVACLDRRSQALAAGFDFSQLQKAFATLPVSASSLDTNPLEKWTESIAQARPARVRENIRFIQRTYYLP